MVEAREYGDGDEMNATDTHIAEEFPAEREACTIAQLAEEQHAFRESLPDDLEDVDLPDLQARGSQRCGLLVNNPVKFSG